MRSEEEQRALEIGRLAPPARGDPFADLTQPRRVGQQLFVHVRRNVTRSDAVDLDVVFGPFVTERLGKLSHRTLCRCVSGDSEAALEGEERAKVDDLAAAARHHVAASGLAEQPHRFEVDIEHLVPVGLGEVGGRVTALDAAAVDDDIDGRRGRLGEGAVEESLDLLEVREVRVDRRMLLRGGLVGDRGERGEDFAKKTFPPVVLMVENKGKRWS